MEATCVWNLDDMLVFHPYYYFLFQRYCKLLYSSIYWTVVWKWFQHSWWPYSKSDSCSSSAFLQVLVLGREKEGIPVEIIHMLDACIEIPQLGVVRSLNVHVSGALALWEYTRQQRLHWEIWSLKLGVSITELNGRIESNGSVSWSKWFDLIKNYKNWNIFWSVRFLTKQTSVRLNRLNFYAL